MEVEGHVMREAALKVEGTVMLCLGVMRPIPRLRVSPHYHMISFRLRRLSYAGLCAHDSQFLAQWKRRKNPDTGVRHYGFVISVGIESFHTETPLKYLGYSSATRLYETSSTLPQSHIKAN